MIYIGIDPGVSGGIAVIADNDPEETGTLKLSETEADVADFLRIVVNSTGAGGDNCTAVLEKVHAMPKQGVTSMFTFGRSYGFLRGLLTAFRIPYREVRPQEWMKVMGCMGKTNLSKKNRNKAVAQRLFPNVKITHANADALLLADYCRRINT